MKWFEGATPTGKEMQEERKRYLAVAYGTKKHIPGTSSILGEMWVRAHTNRIDLWDELSNLNKETARGRILGSSIKAAFRKRLLIVQEGRCCYCRRWLVNNAYAKPIDHVLPKDTYPQFSIDFWNLAVACVDCNSKKSNSVWGAVAFGRKSYPRPHEFADSYHPRFHRYDEHIQYKRTETNARVMVTFIGLTPQGRHLCASLLHIIAAQELLETNNPALAPAITKIRNFGARAEGQHLNHFAEFKTALDRSVLRYLNESKAV